MTRADMIRDLQAQYQQLRLRHEAELDARVEEAARIDPEIARLRAENRDLALSTLRRVMAEGDPEQKRAAAEQMKARGRFNNQEIRRRLARAGLPEDYLQMRYDCAACRDTGMVGDAPSRFCDCFEARLRAMQYEDGTMAGTDRQCFEKFDLSRFPEDGGQRAQMAAVRRTCEKYADAFPHTDFANLMLTGSGGLGKTFLLNCIYERAVRRGAAAVRLTAFRMFEIMRRQHMDGSAEDMSFEQLLNVPLLLIDDLGTEPMMRNITVEYLFTLLNERMAMNRHTVIATNLSPMQVQERYGERVMSRMFDRSRGATIQLTGKDLRRL